MMKSKILATVVYNIVFWGLFLISDMNWWGISAMLLYSVCMPIFFHVAYFVIFPKEEMERECHVHQVVMQIMITVVCAAIMICYIEFRFGPDRGLMSSGGREFIRAFMIGICSTTIFIIARIVSAFRE